MALKLLGAAAVGLMAAAAPASVTIGEPVPTAAPEAGPDAKYCLHIEITGSRLEKILCLTRAEWVEQEVDVDKEWAANGVRVIA